METSGIYMNGLRKSYVLNLRSFLFYMAYTLLFVKEIVLDRTRIDTLIPSNMVSYLSFLCQLAFWGCCVIIMLFLQKYTERELIINLILLAIFSLSVYHTGKFPLFNGLLLIICSKKIEFEKYIKYVFGLQTVCMCLVISLAVTGIIDQGEFVRGIDGTYRNALGFNHPNTISLLLFQWVGEYLYLKRNVLRLRKFVFSGALVIFLYWVTDSNTGFILSVMVILCEAIYEIVFTKIFNERTIKRVIRTILFIAIVVVVFVVRYYWLNPDRLQALTLMSRIKLAQKYLIAYGVSIFGQEIVIGNYVVIPGFPRGYYYLDNTLVWLLVSFGIVATACIVIAYVLYIKKLFKMKNWILIIIVVAYLLYSLTEHIVMAVAFNSLLIGFGDILYNKTIKSEEKIKENNINDGFK